MFWEGAFLYKKIMRRYLKMYQVCCADEGAPRSNSLYRTQISKVFLPKPLSKIGELLL